MGVPKVFRLGKLAYFFYYIRSAYLIGILMLFNFNLSFTMPFFSTGN